ncbi:MAG: T9SS type A sorting domain-containing protein, partial [Chitinophagaceae bacterium]|nr:T9SS type A sorting domain-containing protein [Chitinophagaceae bacterium]
LTAPQYNCDSNKTFVRFDLQGNAPWTFNYTKDGNPLQITTNSDSIGLYLSNGLYQFIQLSDAYCTSTINQGFAFNYNPIDALLSTPAYSCDSNKTRIQFSLQGNPPFEIHYTENGIPASISTNANNLTQYFANGNYDFTTVSDATGCVKNINQSFNFNFNNIGYSLTAPQYNCDSNKTFVRFDLQGNAPWTLNYTKDGNPLQITTNADSIALYLQNGLYQFISCTDAYCSISINQTFQFNKDSIGIQLSTPAYSCDSNKSQIHFSLLGNPPFEIRYMVNGNPVTITTSDHNYSQYFINGNYNFIDVSDATGCTKNINLSFNLNYKSINYTMTAPLYSCDSNKNRIRFDLLGNAPWTLSYTKNAAPLQIVTYADSLELYLDNGLYQFIQWSDASCYANINQSFLFDQDSIGIQLSTPSFNCDSNKTQMQFALQGNPPFTIHYTENGIPQSITTNTQNITRYFTNGNYNFIDLTDATGCMKNIGQSFNFNFNPLSYTMTAPVYHCDSNKTYIHFDLQGNAPYTLSYLINGQPQQVSTNNGFIDLYLTNGTYDFVQIQDNTNCVQLINQPYTLSAQPIYATIAQQYFDCDSNKYRIDLSLQGNGPWTVEYNNGVIFNTSVAASPFISLLLPNGNWVISGIKDATQCEFVLNYAVNVNFNPLSVSTAIPVYDCDSNKTKVQFTLSGNAPWTIHYTDQNAAQTFSVQTYNPAFTLYFSNGLYLITGVHDSTNCLVTLSQNVSNFYTALTYLQNNAVYNCDSNKMQINYSFTGDAPYTLTYKNNITGIISQTNSVLPSAHFYLPDGDYTILSVQDLKCVKTIDDTVHIHYPKLISSLSPAVISCDSGKVFVRLSTPQGNAPYTYKYYFNNQLVSFTTHDTATTLYLNNGQYFFENVTDSMGCTVMYNQSLNAFYLPYQYHGFTKKYNCEKDSTELSFDATIFTKTYIAYTYNGSSTDSFIINPNANHLFIIPDGSYHLLYIADSAGCLQNINQHIEIKEEPIAASYQISLHCDIRKYNFQFQLQGKAPWTLIYNYKNFTQSEIITDSNYSWMRDAGIYYLASISDSNGCRLDIQKSETLKPFLNDYPTLYYKNFALHTIETPYQYFWYKDNQLIDTLSIASIPSYGNGIYKVKIVDDLGCDNWSNELTLDYPANINVFPNPARTVTNIVINDPFGDYWQYQLFDMSGKLLTEKMVETPSAQIDMTNYSSGVYSLIIRYENQSAKQKNVVRLVKD